ncbi:hypothetical protein CSW58_09820 [Caulobacter sp. B11]|uniref:hypothetical protein n=1 Tax=Caulobacter sp. B11 TaxID=2048899 RepID=UPI000C12B38D|nr:hypothetical protein [Caulobacter sp. B11]PHY12851.1 hypothetical protein CSW58_09820 [Caulobacter sp. B11]
MFQQHELDDAVDANGVVKPGKCLRVSFAMMDGAGPAAEVTTAQVIDATRAVMAQDAAVAAYDAYIGDLTAGGTYAPAPHSLPIVTDQELTDAAATARAARDVYLAHLRGEAA